jgi:acyl carrier protein
MSEKPYYEEQFEPAPNAGKENLDSQIDQAAPPVESPPAVDTGSEQTTLKSELGADSAKSAEMGSRLEQAETIKPPEAETGKISGFENSGVMSNEDVQDYVKETLPPEHTSSEKIKEINYPNTYWGDNESRVLGMCTTEGTESKIDIYAQTPDGSYDKDQMEYTITHEVGHNVYHNLAPEQQQQWDAINANSKADEYVTDYARTDKHEDFAESYANYVTNPELLAEVSQTKYNFMGSEVFNGRTYGK